jgi:hypothetical protein
MPYAGRSGCLGRTQRNAHGVELLPHLNCAM